MRTHLPSKLGSALLVAITVLALSFPVTTVRAAAVTSLKDIMSSLTASAPANHEISFVAPSGVTNGQTITVTFPTGFDLTGVTEDDTDIAGSTEGELTTAADCSGTEDASVGIASQTITFTLCAGDGGDFTNSETITIQIGTNAAASGTGANQIDNQTTVQNDSDANIVIGGTMADSGTVAVEIIADDSVSVSATVDPSITFSISDVSIGFGSLATDAARWATGDAAGSATDTAAHTLAIATNATGGYVITYNGSTLTSGDNTIDPASGVDAITDDADGTPGEEQFALGFSTSGDATIASGYDHNATPENRYWRFEPGESTMFVSESGATATETISAYYLANIAALTEAGSYTTSITYVATATF